MALFQAQKNRNTVVLQVGLGGAAFTLAAIFGGLESWKLGVGFGAAAAFCFLLALALKYSRITDYEIRKAGAEFNEQGGVGMHAPQ